MANSFDPLACKESFLLENKLFSEIELNEDSKPIGKLHEFDLLQNEIWLLQCPKGMDVTELENQKLRIPGRTNINGTEAISIEFNEGKQQRAFAYCNRKRSYEMRLLPVRGTVILRDRLKASAIIDEHRAEECCPPAKRVPMPSNIRVRHPLLGVQYEDKIELDKSIVQRLQKADEISAQVLKETLSQRNKVNEKEGNAISPIEINSADDDAVEFVSEEKHTKKKKKSRKHNESNVVVRDGGDIFKNKKSNINEEYVSKDLQWLKNI